jgi:hypothetical protein
VSDTVAVGAMSSQYGHIARCLDLREDDLAGAIGTRAATRELLERLSAVSAPNTGVAKALLVFARMATTACDWIDGDLGVDLVGDDEVTVVELSTDLGGGLRERVLAAVPFRAPLLEFARAIERVPHLIAPLVVKRQTPRRLTLAASAAVRKTTVPPPPIEIADENLFIRIPAARVPTPSPEGDAALLAASGLPVIQGSNAPAAASVHAPAASKPQPTVSVPPVEELDSGWDD